MSGIVDYLSESVDGMWDAAAASHTETAAELEVETAPVVLRDMPYPFCNDWARGCWVARPTGKSHRDFVYAREFLTGVPHKGSGMVRYSLADLGGPGWVVACDRRRVRSLIYAGELAWVDYGEVPPRDVLRVVKAGSWDGSRCEAGHVLLEAPCEACGDLEADRLRVEADRAAAPDVEPF